MCEKCSGNCGKNEIMNLNTVHEDYEQYYTSLQYYENTPGGGQRVVTIDIENTDMTISEFMFYLVKPMLRAAGYHEDLVKEYVKDDYGL